jgi:hypothetical protein
LLRKIDSRLGALGFRYEVKIASPIAILLVSGATKRFYTASTHRFGKANSRLCAGECSMTTSPAAGIAAIMQTAPVIPVIVINDVADAVPTARPLVAGGLRVIEVTLRTPAALQAIAAMKQAEGAIVGAGTVIDVASLDAAINAGAEFIVAPGLIRSRALS